MRIRLTALTLGLYLSFALLGCNKPAAPADSSSSSTSSPSSSDNGDAGDCLVRRWLGFGHVEYGDVEHEARGAEAFGGSRGHRLDGSPRTIGWLKNQLARPDLYRHLGQPGFGGWQNSDSCGRSASGVVVDAKPLGRFKGGASLQLRLTSIAVGGSEQSISTSSVVRTATGKGKRTAVLAGGGAALGALIGGLAGGGKGAGIGALAGGGAGAGGAAFTGNKDIVLPAESALSFKLEQPIEVK